jgi:osmoprotectant transport system substrate-binding protein
MKRRAFLTGLAASALVGCGAGHDRLTVGSKNFTEQLILGELLAQALEAETRSAVDRRFYLAGSYICHQALLAGRIDMYVEYTGTALAAILKEQPNSSESDAVFQHVRNEYQRRFGLAVMPPLGFDNTFAMVMRPEDARRLKVATLSEVAPVAPKLRIGVGYEFLERKDGLPGLAATYGLKFADAPRVMDLGLLYRALLNKQVDIVAGSNTDGLIGALGLTVLKDDKHYFPPYDAVPIVRSEALSRDARVNGVLQRLAGRVTADAMRKMNYAVDGEKRDAAEVAKEFLQNMGH